MTRTARRLDTAQERIRTARTVRRTHVQAVAGAGKTKVLIDRAQYLVGQGVDAQRIWFLVFSGTAAQELSERLSKASLGGCKVQTLHAFCLNQFSGTQRVSILKDTDVRWRAILADLHLKYRRFGKALPKVLEETWRVPTDWLSPERRQLRVTAEQCIRSLDSEFIRHLTFSQVLIETHEDWKQRPSALKTLGNQFDHLIVDECQDISPIQAELIEQLAGNNALLTVGDRNQAIFGFQGATPDVIQGFMDRATEQHSLDVSYRCPAQHSLVAEALTGQVMVPAKGFQGSLRVYRSSGVHLIDTLQRVVQGLADQTADGPVAVLAATNREVDEITAFLREIHLVVQIAGKSTGMTDPYCRSVLWPVVQFLAGQRRIHSRSPHGPNPLLLLADSTAGPVQDREILHVVWRTRRYAIQLLSDLTGSALGHLITVWQALEEWSGALGDLPELLNTLLPGHPNREMARHLCQTSNSLEELQHRLVPHAPEAALQVVVSTIHAAKGREWSRVVLYDAGSTSRTKPTEEERQEAVRQRYVAVTRSTRDLVAVLGPDCHPAYRSAFDPALIARIRRLETLFAAAGAPGVSDPRLTADLTSSPSIQRYVSEFSALHVTPETQQLEQLLEIGEATSTQRPFFSVRRIPLTGLKRPVKH